jgi:hypothetical protein
MQSSCRLQSELAVGLGVCSDSRHCAPLSRPIVSRVQPRASEGHADLASSSPSSPAPTPKLYSFGTRAGAVSCDTCNTRRGLRSLPHLREQFKPRADDGHASPVCPSCEVPSFLGISCRFLALVRFFAYRRIKPHDPPLVRVPVYSFEF